MLRIDTYSGQIRRGRAPASRFPFRFWCMYWLHYDKRLPKDLCRKICSYLWDACFYAETRHLVNERDLISTLYKREWKEIHDCTMSCLRFETRGLRISLSPMRREKKARRTSLDCHMFHHKPGKTFSVVWCVHRGKWDRNSPKKPPEP